MDAPLAPDTFARTHRVIWLALSASTVVYGAILFVVAPTREGALPGGDVLPAIFAALAASIAALSFWWRRRYQNAATPTAAGVAPWAETAARLGPASIVAWALSESVAVLGLALGMLSGRVDVYVPFLAGSLLLFYLHRPHVWAGWPGATH